MPPYNPGQLIRHVGLDLVGIVIKTHPSNIFENTPGAADYLVGVLFRGSKKVSWHTSSSLKIEKGTS